jgi:hypothetical protein
LVTYDDREYPTNQDGDPLPKGAFVSLHYTKTNDIITPTKFYIFPCYELANWETYYNGTNWSGYYFVDYTEKPKTNWCFGVRKFEFYSNAFLKYMPILLNRINK